MAQENKKPNEDASADHDNRLLAKLEEIRQTLVVTTSDDLSDLLRSSRSMRRVMVTNFFLGLSRGVGFFIGMSFLGAAILGIGVLLADKAVDQIGGEEIRADIAEFMDNVMAKLDTFEGVKKADPEKETTPTEPEAPAPNVPALEPVPLNPQ